MSQLLDSADFAAQLRYLEDVVRAGDISTVEAAFRPASPAGCRFWDGLRAAIQRGDTDVGQRAVRVLEAIWTGQGRFVGRPPTPVTASVETIRRARAINLTRVRGVWPHADRLDRLCLLGVSHLAPERSIRRQRLRHLLSQPWARPSDAANLLTALDNGVSVRQVRAAVRSQESRSFVYA